MYNAPAHNESRWPLLNEFRENVSQFHTLPPRRLPYDTQLLDTVANKYRDNCLTLLAGDFFNRQERMYAKVYADHDDAERYRKQANTDLKE